MKRSISNALPNFVFLALLLSGCAPLSTPAAPAPTLTNTPVSAATATKKASTPTPSAIPTAQGDATAEPVEENDQAASAVDAVIVAALEELGYDPRDGELGWSHTVPLELTADEQDSPLSDLRAKNPIFENFILSMDIDWGEFSKGTIGGCGIAFHARDNFKGEAVLFRTRLQPVFNSWNLEHWGDGYQGSLLGGDPIDRDGIYEDAIGPGNNRYVLLVEDGTVTAFANGKEIGSASLPPGLRDGRIGVFPWAVAGSSTCKFSNGWVWRLP